MKTMFLLSLLALATNAHASNTEIVCTSDQYQILVTGEPLAWTANYRLLGEDWNTAEVFAEQAYLTSRGLAVSLNVDGQTEKIEVIATFDSALLGGKTKLYKGKIHINKNNQKADCFVTSK